MKSTIFYFSKTIFFLCHEIELLKFDTFLCSVEIRDREPSKLLILKQTELIVKKSFEKIKLGDKSYVIADCLNVPAE